MIEVLKKIKKECENDCGFCPRKLSRLCEGVEQLGIELIKNSHYWNMNNIRSALKKLGVK